MKLKLAQLYPCARCPAWNVDEWWLDGETTVKHKHVREFQTTMDALKYYQGIFGLLKASIYDPHTDSYSSQDDDCNFIVTGSHGLCHACQKPARTI